MSEQLSCSAGSSWQGSRPRDGGDVHAEEDFGPNSGLAGPSRLAGQPEFRAGLSAFVTRVAHHLAQRSHTADPRIYNNNNNYYYC